MEKLLLIFMGSIPGCDGKEKLLYMTPFAQSMIRHLQKIS